MVPCSGGSADARVDKGSGTCSSVSLVLRCAPPQTARPATSIATLRCKTVSGQACHRLADALRSIGPRAARLLPQTRTHRTFKEKRSRSAVSCSARSACSTTASSPCWSVPPGPPRGKTITRETKCQRHRQCPESAKINIIPSVLWNSRQHPHCHAFTASIFEGQ